MKGSKRKIVNSQIFERAANLWFYLLCSLYLSVSGVRTTPKAGRVAEALRELLRTLTDCKSKVVTASGVRLKSISSSSSSSLRQVITYFPKGRSDTSIFSCKSSFATTTGKHSLARQFCSSDKSDN